MKMDSYKPKEKNAKYKNPDIRQFIYDKFVENSEAVAKPKNQKAKIIPGHCPKRILKRPRQTICAEIAAEIPLRLDLIIGWGTNVNTFLSVPTIKRISKSDDFKDFKDAAMYPNGTMKKRPMIDEQISLQMHDKSLQSLSAQHEQKQQHQQQQQQPAMIHMNTTRQSQTIIMPEQPSIQQLQPSSSISTDRATIVAELEYTQL